MNRDKLIDLIYQSSRLMDEEQFDDFLHLCDSQFTYTISAKSDELGCLVIWLQKDKDGLEHLLKNANIHERHTGRLRRHVSMVRIVESDGNMTETESSVAVYHTEVNGQTELYAVGQYRDQIIEVDGALRLAKREVMLDTRRLAFGPHVPV